MAFPVSPLKMPSALVNADNGNLGPEVLVDVEFAGRGKSKLFFNTARAWWALTAACQAATGVTLTVTSLGDAYRPYSSQLSLFLRRYTPISYATYLITASNKRRKFSYNGSTWWKLNQGMAMAATPGHSNHGLGLAIDACEITYTGQIVGLSSSKAWQWMLANAHRFGFSWEVQSEPWHIRYVAGDLITSSVLQFENNAPESPMPPYRPEMNQFGLWTVAVKPRISQGAQGDVVRYLQDVIFFKAGGDISRDGKFGPQTAKRVMDLQRWFGAQVDGWVGPETWHLIDVLATQ